jgi:hypothetical protein
MAALFIFTFCTYIFYWLYKNLNAFSENPPSGMESRFVVQHPLASTALFFVPIANLMIALQFFALVGEIGPAEGSFSNKHSSLMAFLLAAAFGALFLLSLLPEPYFLFYLSACLPIAWVQHELNQYWQKTEADDLVVRAAFNPVELVIIFLGAAFLGLCAIGPSVIPHH